MTSRRLLQAVPGRRQDEFRLPVGAVEAQARDGVSDLRIGEAPRDELVVFAKIDAWHRRHAGHDLFRLQLVEKSAHMRVGHRIVNEVDAQERRGIGDGRVTAVENAQLHQFEGRHLGVKVTPTSSSAGRPAGNGPPAPIAGTARRRRASCPRCRTAPPASRARDPSVAGVMRSTMLFGNATSSRTRRRASGSTRSASPVTASCVTSPVTRECCRRT